MTRPVIGVVGGGQLARMLHQSAISLAVDLLVLADADTDPAVHAGARFELGSADDPQALRRLAEQVDVVTFDHEVVDLDAARALEADGHVLHPSAAALSVVADKVTLRQRLAHGGLAQPDFVVLDESGASAATALDRWSAAVIKPARGGYDGRGVFMVSDLPTAEGIVEPILADGGRVLIEPRLDLDGELAVMVVRRADGASVTYPPVTTVQRDGMCVEVDLPSGLDPALLDEARTLALAVATSLEVVGLCAVELFVVDGRLLVNELAVRPHNTAHLTIDASRTSQFENHLRAVADLPLGGTEPLVPAAVMVNVVGGDAGADPRDLLADAYAVDPDAHIHLYAKTPRPGRKIGHVTVTGDTVADARRRAWAVSVALGSPEGDQP